MNDGYCQCGCGQKTTIATRSCSKLGWVKGKPQRFIQGHMSTAARARTRKPKHTCSEPNCDMPAHGQGLCQSHYDILIATPHRRSGCAICGGPKPAGLGRKICDECKPITEESARAKRRQYEAKYYAANRERFMAESAERYRTDPEYRRQRSEQARRWAEENPEELQRRRHHARARKYGLTVAELDTLLARGCAFCGTTESLHVDHCHTSGKVRDALCRRCNTALGVFGDDPARLRAAAEYLEKHA